MKKIFVVLFVVALTALSNVAFAGAVAAPEPVSTTLFLLGGTALVIRRICRKK